MVQSGQNMACGFALQRKPKRCNLESMKHGNTVGASEAARVLGKLGGAATSARKSEAARRNGKLGGRPKGETCATKSTKR